MKSTRANHRTPPSRRKFVVGATALSAGLAIAGTVRDLFAGEAKEGEGTAPVFKDLTQIAFIVKDIEATAKKTAELFGQPVPKAITTDPVEKSHTVYRGAPSPARAKLAFLKLGPVTLELIEPVGGPSTWKEALDKHGESIHHLAFRVPDMDDAFAVLKKKGFEPIQTGDFTGGCYAYLDLSPAVPVVVELLAPPRRSA